MVRRILFSYMNSTSHTFDCRRSITRLTIVRGELATLVIASELDINPGPSITNSAEALWENVKASADTLDISGQIIQVEHYEPSCGFPATFDLVWINNDTPNWRRSSLGELVVLAGVSMDDHKELIKLFG